MENRISTIKNELTAFENAVYNKKDVLSEFLLLQGRMAAVLPGLTVESPKIYDMLDCLNLLM